MTFGTGEGGRIADPSQILSILALFSSYGYNELDTARMYWYIHLISGGNTEEVLGQLSIPAKYVLATKAFPFTPGMHSRELLKNQFCESLNALKTKCVDIFYLHAPDHATMFEETLAAVHDLYQKSKFKELGLSNYSAWQVMEIYKICTANGYVLPTVYQGRYNVISRDVEPELFPCLRKLGIRFYAYNPLAGGLLAGKYSIDSIPEEGRYQLASKQGMKYRDRFWNQTYFDAIALFKQGCDKHSISYTEAAHRWIMRHSMLDGSKGDGIR